MFDSDKAHYRKPYLWLIYAIGVIVPRRFRADWRQEWEAELRSRERLLAEWDRLDWRNKLDLLRRSVGAFRDALLLQPKRLEDEMFQDLRYGARMLVRSPGFTVVAVLSLALGIGANTAIFSLIDALLLKRLPVQQPERLVIVNTATPMAPEKGSSIFSYPVFREMREKNTALSGMFARSGLQMSLSGGGQTDRVLGELVSGNFFSLLGVDAHLGRLLTEADDQAPGAGPVAVLSYNFWERRFAADPGIIGKTVRLNGYPFTVIGVAAKGFHGVEVGVAPDVHIPILMNTEVRPGPPVFERRGNWWLSIMARLKPGVSMEQAQASLDNVYQIAREQDVRRNTGETPDDRGFRSLRIQLVSAKSGASRLSREYTQPLIVLMCLVGVVLLIACLNVANLLLARAARRSSEIALRLALGAGRFRLVRQLLTEGLLLSVLGGALGLLFARWGTVALISFVPQGRNSSPLEIEPDLRMLGFTLVITALTGLLFGLAPALQATRTNLISAIKNTALSASGGRRWELRRFLVTMQVALSLILLVGAGLFARSLRNLKSVDDGYYTDQVVTMALDPAQSGYNPDQTRNFYEQLIERVSTLPNVKATVYTRNLPMSGSYSRIGVEIPGYQPRPGEEMATLLNQVSPQFFSTFGTPFLTGRDINPQDTPESPKVVIINAGLARRYFGDENPLGRRITLENYRDLEIVGVVADAKYRNLKETPPPTAFIPYSQYNPTNQRTLCVRAMGNPMDVVAAIRRQAQSLDPNLPFFNIKTFDDQIEESVSRERLVAWLSTFFGLFALLLAALGLYGVMAYNVARRTREIGVRIALGARAETVVWMVMRDTLVMALIGVAIGMPLALATTRLTDGLLFGLSGGDPLTISIAALVMIVVATLAGYLPARRAARVDPLVALRYE